MFKALIVDDHPLFRNALRQVIGSLFGDSHEILEAGTVDEAESLVGGHADQDLDVILLDLHLPGSNGFSCLIELRNRAPSVPIIVVSASASGDVIRDSLTYGASGFIPKSFSSDGIRDALQRVISGQLFMPPVGGFADPYTAGNAGKAHADEPKLSALTHGELRVLELLAKGKANKIIAFELGIKESTVKAHVTAILRKLGVHSRTQAVLAARELGFRSA
ncbi:MAG: response regulator transcription factor [Rhodospirillales bacterium]|nr:response regulator transcription factor [Rhodospirillales bacterium]